MTVLLSVGYCTVSSVAAPPRHLVPLFQILVMFRVGARECGFAIQLVHVLSSRIASGVREKDLTARSLAIDAYE